MSESRSKKKGAVGMRLSLRLRMKAGSWLGGLLFVLLACSAA